MFLCSIGLDAIELLKLFNLFVLYYHYSEHFCCRKTVFGYAVNARRRCESGAGVCQ